MTRRMTKAQARKRLNEAKRKVRRVLWEADHHLTTREMNQLDDIIKKIHSLERGSVLR